MTEHRSATRQASAPIERRITIPADLRFADLHLAIESDGSVSMDWQAIKRICDASGIDIALFRDGPEDDAAGLVVHWYQEHRQHGGAPDPVAEHLIAEMLAEQAAGQVGSHPPGRA